MWEKDALASAFIWRKFVGDMAPMTAFLRSKFGEIKVKGSLRFVPIPLFTQLLLLLPPSNFRLLPLIPLVLFT